jgi:hypothetical protein
MLVVHFKIRDMDVIVCIRRGVLLNALEQLFAGPRNQSRLRFCPHHCITLAGSSLTIRKYASVVPIEVVIEEFLSEGSIHIFLVSIMGVRLVVGPERLVEYELLVVVASTSIWTGGMGIEVDGGGKQGGRLGGRIHSNDAW